MTVSTMSMTGKTGEKRELLRHSLARTWTGVSQEEVPRVNERQISQEYIFFEVKDAEDALKKGALRLWAVGAEEEDAVPDKQVYLFSES